MSVLGISLAGLGLYLAVGAVLAALGGRFSLTDWLYQLFLAWDQLMNVLATPFNRGAWADETMSSRAWRADRDGKPWGRVVRPFFDLLFAWQRAPGGHCRRAYEREMARLHSPPEQRPTTKVDRAPS